MKNKKGFSLIELLVVIGIMSVLTTIVYVSVNQTRSKSRDQERISAILKIKLGLEYYYNLYGQYPQRLSDLYSGPSPLPATSPGKITANDLIPPNGDQNNHGYYYVPLFKTEENSFCNSYHLYTKLESKTSVYDSRSSYNSEGDLLCIINNYTPTDLRINASSSSNIIYDVRPQ